MRFLGKTQEKFASKGGRRYNLKVEIETPLPLWYLILKVLERENQPGKNKFYDHYIQIGGTKLPEVLHRMIKLNVVPTLHILIQKNYFYLFFRTYLKHKSVRPIGICMLVTNMVEHL